MPKHGVLHSLSTQYFISVDGDSFLSNGSGYNTYISNGDYILEEGDSTMNNEEYSNHDIGEQIEHLGNYITCWMLFITLLIIFIGALLYMRT